MQLARPALLMNHSNRALIFDFDGLIVDSETPDFVAWQEIYRAHGAELFGEVCEPEEIHLAHRSHPNGKVARGPGKA